MICRCSDEGEVIQSEHSLTELIIKINSIDNLHRVTDTIHYIDKYDIEAEWYDLFERFDKYDKNNNVLYYNYIKQKTNSSLNQITTNQSPNQINT